MSKKGSKKEAIFTLYLKKFPQCIEDLLGFELTQIRTEVDKGAKKIDLQAIDKMKKVDIYIENQLKPSDRQDHLEQKILPLLQNIAEGFVIWTATKFHQEHIDILKKFLRNNPQKYINFYAVEINPAVITLIQHLNSLYELDVWENLSVLNAIEPKLLLVDKHEQMPPNHIGKAFIGQNHFDFSREDDIKEYMIQQLRDQIPYFLNFHNSKKHSRYDKILKVGGGKSDVTYFASALDVRYRAFVELRFGKKQEDLYHFFHMNEMDIKKEVCESIQFQHRNRSIGVYFKPNSDNIPETVKQLVKVFERFINYFSPYIYLQKEIKIF